MSYGMFTGALSRGRSTRFSMIFALAATAAALLALTISAGNASAAFVANGYSLGVSSTQAGSHPAVTLSASNDPLQANKNNDDLRTLDFELPAGMLLNPKAVPTPCPTNTFNTGTCSAQTKVGSLSVTYRVGSTNYTVAGTVYSITPDADSLINFGFVVNASSKIQKFLFKSSKTTGLSKVRQGLDKDYGLTITIPEIPYKVKSNIGLSTDITISNIAVKLDGRSGFTSYPVPSFVTAPTRCDAAVSAVKFLSYLDVAATRTSSYTPTGCNLVKSEPSFEIAATNPKADQATGMSATVYVPNADKDLPIQHSHLKDISVDLEQGTTVNLTTLNALTLCSEAQLASDTCPAASKIGTASAAVPLLVGSMTGEIYLTSRDTIKFGYVLRGTSGTKAILRGSVDVTSDSYTGGGLRANFQTLPQVPWTSANLNFTSKLVNNPKQSCPNATAWAEITGYSGSATLNGAYYSQTGCEPDTTLTTTVSGTTITRTPKFEFTSSVAGSTFECSVDAAAFASCATPFTAPSLADGAHTFAVRAVSGGTPDPSPATASFRVDATPPTITIASPAADATLTTTSATLEFTTERGAMNYCAIDSGSVAACASPKVFTDLADGVHKITIIAIDNAGNGATLQRSFTVAVPKTPNVSITAPDNNISLPTNRVTPIFTATSPSGTPITKITCSFFVVFDLENELEYPDPNRTPKSCKSGDQMSVSENSLVRLEIDVTDANGLSSSAMLYFTTAIAPPRGFSVNEADMIDGLGITERTPSFRLTFSDPRWPNPQLECALVATGATPAWASCGTPENLPPFQVTSPLANGTYELMTRVSSGTVTGDPMRMGFTVGDWSSSYTATTTTQVAGAHPDLDVNIKPTGAGQMRSVDMSLPKGLIGSLNSFPSCGDIVKAICPANTKVGAVDLDYTVHGGVIIAKRALGDVYFTGPQAAGDVAGLVIRVFGPIKPYADVIIPLRIQLTNNAQVMRVFSDSIPTDVGNIYDATKFIRYWLKDFKMHINGSTGSPHPLLTNPSSCAAGQFSTVTGGLEGPKTAVQTIPYQATDCAALPFNPTMTQTFSSTAAGTLSGVTANVSIPQNNASFKTLRVTEPAQFGPYFPAFGVGADQCTAAAAPTTGSTFDPSFCPEASVVGSMTIISPLLDVPLEGKVYLINKSPLPWLGVALDGVGIHVRLTGVTSLPQVDPACDPLEAGECPQQIAVSFGNLPDIQATNISFSINGPDRVGSAGTALSGKILTVATANDSACVPSGIAKTAFTPNSGTAAVNAVQTFAFTGCNPQ